MGGKNAKESKKSGQARISRRGSFSPLQDTPGATVPGVSFQNLFIVEFEKELVFDSTIRMGYTEQDNRILPFLYCRSSAVV